MRDTGYGILLRPLGFGGQVRDAGPMNQSPSGTVQGRCGILLRQGFAGQVRDVGMI